MFEAPRYCPMFAARKINRTRHSFGVSVAKNNKCRISEPGKHTVYVSYKI